MIYATAIYEKKNLKNGQTLIRKTKYNFKAELKKPLKR